MAKQKLRFLKRRGHALVVRDTEGDKVQARLTKVDAEAPVRDQGSFTFGYCKSCDWVGTARRARGKARHDAEEHLEACAGKGKVRIAVASD